MHGGTQNTNESYHNLIWERCPKTTFVGISRLQLAVSDASIVYNEGESARLTIFQALELSCGSHLKAGLNILDSNRVNNAYAPGDKGILKARRSRSEIAKNQANGDKYGVGKF